MRQRPSSSPDWETWKHYLSAPVYQAVALSLNINPENIRGLDSDPIGGLIFKNTPPDFQKRINIAINHVAENKLKTKSIFPNLPLRIVDLSVFSAWCEEIGWVLPDEFSSFHNVSEFDHETTIKPPIGRPSIWDWEGAVCATWAAIYDATITPGTKNTRKEIRNYINSWLKNKHNTTKTPAASAVLQRINLIDSFLNKDNN